MGRLARHLPFFDWIDPVSVGKHDEDLEQGMRGEEDEGEGDGERRVATSHDINVVLISAGVLVCLVNVFRFGMIWGMRLNQEGGGHV